MIFKFIIAYKERGDHGRDRCWQRAVATNVECEDDVVVLILRGLQGAI